MPQVDNVEKYCPIDWGKPLKERPEIKLSDIPQGVKDRYAVKVGTLMPFSGRKVVA